MASARPSEVDLASRVDRLTAGQRACLDLVDDHATSKEIARELGISRHTVDARLRGAIQTLGVSSRREAAIIYRAAMQAQAYQPFAYQSPRIVTGLRAADHLPHEDANAHSESVEPEDGASALPDGVPENADVFPAAFYRPAPPSGGAVGVMSDSAVWTTVPAPDFTVRQAPLRLWGGSNDLSPVQRMVGILVVMIFAMLAFGVFLSGIEALTLLRS